MTSRIIYHDFKRNDPISTPAQQAPTVSLTAAVLTKGRRLAALANALNIACVTLCGACIGVSVLIITNLIRG